MSEKSSTNITTEEAFHKHINAIVQAAAANGVDPRGGWVCHSSDGSNFEIQIVELADGTPPS